MTKVVRILTGLSLLAIGMVVGCSGGGGGATSSVPSALTPVLSTPPAALQVFNLTWTSSFTTGDQSGTMLFPNPAGLAVVTLQINDTLSGFDYGLPYSLQVVPQCVSFAATAYPSNYTITPKSTGSCVITVTNSYGDVQVVSAVVRSL